MITTADGPRLIDWTWSIGAPAAFDLAWSHIALTELFAEVSDKPQRPLAVDAAVQSEYARLAGMSQPGRFALARQGNGCRVLRKYDVESGVRLFRRRDR